MSLVADFIRQVGETWKTRKATEHSYRPALKTLFDGLKPGEITATNEPKRIACGAPVTSAVAWSCFQEQAEPPGSGRARQPAQNGAWWHRFTNRQ